MRCPDCNAYLPDEPTWMKLPTSICHRCRQPFEPGEVLLKYGFDNYNPQGLRTHFCYSLDGYLCPNCEQEFGGHEFYCGYVAGSTAFWDATERHPKHGI